MMVFKFIENLVYYMKMPEMSDYEYLLKVYI